MQTHPVAHWWCRVGRRRLLRRLSPAESSARNCPACSLRGSEAAVGLIQKLHLRVDNTCVADVER
eukprot:463044-Amphidinium_carterae.1